jgi:hypothetical protein
MARGAAIFAVALTFIAAACASSIATRPSHTPSSSWGTTPSSAATPASATPSAAIATPSAPRSPDAAADGPPVAMLAAEGGDPVDGQLGTYTWGGSGSDAPWLHGVRVAIGAGEPLNVAFRPPVAVDSWRARVVPASADGPAGARLLGYGLGDPLFGAPEAGTWTVEVHVVFAGGAGNASYFWQLAVD